MTLSTKLLVLAATCLLIVLSSCNSSKKVTSTVKAPSEESLLEMTTIKRLIAMQTGTFLMYTDSTATKIRPSGSDTLILFSCPVGDPNKDGYWVYQKMYMSSIPDEPLSIDFLHFNKVSRDSFHVEQYKGDKKYAMADQRPSLFKELEFNGLESVNCPLIFEKLDQLKFEGTTPVCTIDFDGGKSQIYANLFRVTPQGFYLRSAYYKTIEGEVKHVSNGTCYFKRI